MMSMLSVSRTNVIFFFQAEDGIRYLTVTGVQTCALPICRPVHEGRQHGGDDVDGEEERVGAEQAEHAGAAAHLARASRPPGAAARREQRDRQDHFLGRRSEEHTSELQSQSNLVCRLLLEK